MYKSLLKCILPVISLTAGFAYADEFKLTSTDIAHDSFMSKAFEFNGFGCSGENKSPQLSWSGAPSGTQAYTDHDYPTQRDGTTRHANRSRYRDHYRTCVSFSLKRKPK